MTRCVVAGGGPGGMLTAYLLARCGVEVTLLEEHRDFRRDFRGDSLHPATLELLDQLGLADRLLALEHYRARYFRFHTPSGTLTTTDYGMLKSKFPYVALMPQYRFLDFLAGEAKSLPGFTLRLGAKVIGLLRDGDRVSGVRCRDAEGEHELAAELVIGADGRFSTIRRLADMPAHSLGASTDLLWFRLPRKESDPPDADVSLYFGADCYFALLGGETDWQVGYTLPKGGYPAVREAGVAALRNRLAGTIGWLADRAGQLTDFKQTTLLSVDISRVDAWHRPGLLLLGDAAHVISPVGGNGILMAIQDAVAAVNILVPALRSGPGPVPEERLAAVRAARLPAIERVQAQQVRTERRSARLLAAGKPFRPGLLLKLITSVPAIRRRSARANGYGPDTPTLDTTLLVSG